MRAGLSAFAQVPCALRVIRVIRVVSSFFTRESTVARVGLLGVLGLSWSLRLLGR